MPIASRHLHAVLGCSLALAFGLGAVACSDAGGGKADPSAVVGEPATTSPGGSSTTTTTPTTTTAAAPVGAPSPDAASAALYAAFQAGDRAAAARVAEPPAIDAVFAAAPGPYQPYRGCDTGEFGTSGCLYRDRTTNHTIQFDMERRGDAWVVATAFYSTD